MKEAEMESNWYVKSYKSLQSILPAPKLIAKKRSEELDS